MALDRSGISVEGRTLLSSLKSRDFNITVRVLLTEPKLSMSEIIQMTASKALDGTHCILPSRASLGTEVNVIADGFSSIPEGLNDYPSGHTVLLLVTPDGGSEVCLMGASCDETIVADSRLHLLINLEETDGIFNPSVDFDSYVPQGIINDMFSSMKDSLGQYVTVGTNQTVTGQKVFTGTLNVSSPSDADNVYLQIQTGGDKKYSPVSSLYFWDTHRNVLGGVGFESSGNGTNQFLTSYVRRYANNYNTFVSGVVDQKMVSNHYNVLVDDSCVFFESPDSDKPPVGAWHEAARALSDYYAESTDIGRKQAATYSSTDDYRERIRLRRVLYQEQITDTPKGTVKTYVDLYAQNITNVADTVKFQYTENETYTLRLWNDQAGNVVDTPVTGPVPHDLLTISKDGGVYSTHFRGGYEIGNTSYSFGSAGSLTFETSVPVNADNAHLPTSLAVKDYVDSSVSSSMSTIISDLHLGTASAKNFSTDMSTPSDLPTTSAITSYISNQGFATTSQIPTRTSNLTNDSGFITAQDLPNVPDVVSAFTNDAGYITSEDLPTKTSDLANDSGFITASSIPTKTSDLTNDSGYITSQDIPSIPSKTSDLTNDSGFITSSSLPTKTSDLTNDLGFITSSDLPTYPTVPSNVSSFNNDVGYITASDIPSIPSKTSDLTNDSGFITSAYLPTKTSDLTNDSGFITTGDIPVLVSYFTNDSGYITASDIPPIPSKTSDLTNDSGYITSASLPTKVSDLTNDSKFITASSLPTKVSELTNDSGFITSSDGSITNKALASEAVYSGTYDSNSKKILLKNKANTTLAEIDATAFIKDGMVSQVEVSNGNLVITFNTDAGKNPISVPISDIFDANNYYTKTEADSKFLTSHQSLSNYVTLSTDQDITGNKTFSGSLSSNSDVGSSSSGITRDRVIMKNGTSVFSHAEGGATGGGYDVQYRSSQIYQGEYGLHIEPKAYGSYSGDNGQLMSEPSSPTKEGNVYIGVESTGSYIRVMNTTSGGYTALKGSLYLPKASEITVSSETGSSNIALSTYIQSLIPSQATVNNATLTIQKNGITVQTFTANSNTDKTANITVPTAMADLSDSSSYVLQRGQEFVEGVYENKEFWVQSSQDSLYNGMCLNIYVPVRVCSDHITVKTSTGNYRHNIYYRGHGSAHAPVIHAGSMLSITFHNTDSNHIGWYADTYDIAHWKQHPEDFTKNFVGRLLPTNSDFTHTLNVSHGVDSGLNFLMMDTEGNWYPFLARNAAESSAPPISGKSFDVSQIVWDASSGHSDEGSGVFFSSHPKASIKHLMPYISWKKPCDLCRHDSEQRLYSDFDLYMRSCDPSPSREPDVRALVTSILNGHVNSGGEISGTVGACVDSIMTSVSQKRFPILICSKYHKGAWEAIRSGMYTGDASEGFTPKDKFAEFVQYKAGAPVWLNLQRNDADGLYPLNLSFRPCVYSDYEHLYDMDACVLVGFMNGVDNLNFIQNHPVYYNAGDSTKVDLRPYNVKEKLVDADVQGSFVGTISLPHGTCTTERSTDAKVVSSLDDFPRSEFQDGDLVFVKFSDGNTSTHPTLNIKGTGAVAVRTSPSTYLGNVPEGDTLLLRYDTDNNLNNPEDSRHRTWYVVSSSGSSNLYTARTVDGVSFDGSANVTHYDTCYTASDTAEKTVSVPGFVLETGARVTVNFLESNTAANPTLNVHNGSAYTGAKAIMYRGNSSVSGSSDYYRWQAGDIVDFIYDGTNWVMVGWQTYAYYAESATSATTSTYATCLSYSTTNLLTASDTSTVTSSATIRPSSNGGSSLGSPSYKWGIVYANFIGSSAYPVSTAYINAMQGTASRATSDDSGNIIKSTYLKSVTLVNSSGTDLTFSGRVGVQESGTYVVPNKWPVLLRLTKGSGTTTDIGLRSLLCSYLMGIPNNNISTSSNNSLGVSGAEGCLAILQVYRTSPNDTIQRGRLVSSYSTVSVRGIEASGESGYLEWSSNPASISGTWVAINHTTASSGSYNYCMVLAVRIY